MQRVHSMVFVLVLPFLASFAQAEVELAKVNGQKITDSELTKVLSGMPAAQRSSVLQDRAARKQLVNSLIDQQVLIQEGEKLKLDQSKEFKEALDMFRRQYLATQILERNLSSKLTDTEARRYYEVNKQRFSTDQAHVQHILTSDELTAKDLLRKAKAPNADFQALAEKFSKDPSAKNNRGDIGIVLRDSPFVEEFKEAVFRTPEGEIVGPIKTSFGYHLIKVVEKKSGRPLNYDEVELRVKGELREKLVANFVKKLRAQAKVTINDRAIENQ